MSDKQQHLPPEAVAMPEKQNSRKTVELNLPTILPAESGSKFGLHCKLQITRVGKEYGLKQESFVAISICYRAMAVLSRRQWRCGIFGYPWAIAAPRQFQFWTTT